MSERDDLPVAEIRGQGEAADGQVRALAARDGLTRVELEPRMMRSTLDELAAHLTAAVNAAFDDLRSKTRSELAAADADALAQHLDEVQNQGLRTMAMITQALSDAVATLNPSTGMTGDAAPQGLDRLLEQTRSAVEAVRGGAGEAAETHGEAAEGQVRATLAPSGRLSSLDLDPRLAKVPSVELAGHVVAAVNAALAEMRAAAAERVGIGRVDTEKLRALSAASTEQMINYTRSLRDLMNSVQER